MEKEDFSFWTTADGRRIKYKDLEDQHLSNIWWFLKIFHKASNPWVNEEIEKRFDKVPQYIPLPISGEVAWLQSQGYIINGKIVFDGEIVGYVKKSPIIQFYEGGTDDRGRTLEDILAYDNKMFDECHDFIQWLFPLHEESRMTNVKLPIIRQFEHEYFSDAAQWELCVKMLKAVERYVQFLAEMGPDFWCNNNDHNLLRITRMIRSLRLFGLETNARNVYDHYKEIAINRGISSITIHYWDRALYEPIFKTLY